MGHKPPITLKMADFRHYNRGGDLAGKLISGNSEREDQRLFARSAFHSGRPALRKPSAMR